MASDKEIIEQTRKSFNIHEWEWNYMCFEGSYIPEIRRDPVLHRIGRVIGFSGIGLRDVIQEAIELARKDEQDRILKKHPSYIEFAKKRLNWNYGLDCEYHV
jgi:hypothetical protein